MSWRPVWEPHAALAGGWIVAPGNVEAGVPTAMKIRFAVLDTSGLAATPVFPLAFTAPLFRRRDGGHPGRPYREDDEQRQHLALQDHDLSMRLRERRQVARAASDLFIKPCAVVDRGTS